jgi:hypothetical protein
VVLISGGLSEWGGGRREWVICGLWVLINWCCLSKLIKRQYPWHVPLILCALDHSFDGRRGGDQNLSSHILYYFP